MERLISQDLWNISRPDWMSDSEWDKFILEELGGHTFLKLAVSQDSRLTTWLIEVEGDLFEFRFISTSSFDEKIAVLKSLYSAENVKEVQEINNMYNIDIYRHFNISDTDFHRRKTSSSKSKFNIKDSERKVAIRFTKIPTIIGARKALLYKGWGIVSIANIRLAVKREFEKQLREVIEKSKNIVEQDAGLKVAIKPLFDKLQKIAKSRKLSADYLSLGIDEGVEILTKPNLFPPCIQELIGILKSEGHLAHMENWQLGIFLKKAGMTVEEQQRFWYENSVDNIGISFEQFKQRVNYQIKHMYGQVGGGIDYSPPSCTKCVDSYYCYWAHKKPDKIIEDIKMRFEDKEKNVLDALIEDLSRILRNQRYKRACARYFTFLTGWTIKGNQINQMMHYTKQAYRRFYGKTGKSSTDNEEENND
jgi:DNA primase large subunit